VIAGLCAWRTILTVRATAREHKRYLLIATGRDYPEAEASTVRSVNVDDVMLCRIYGELARAHYGEQWDMCENRLREGWLRVRGRSQMEWSEAGPLIRKGWDSQVQLVCRRDLEST
jgi:hypothetical protein